MSNIKYLIAALPLAGALLLTSCGGGGAQDQQAGQIVQGIAVGEPNGAVPVASEFIAKAQDESCADLRNRLFMIDQRMVFWDRAGSCGDNSYARRLFGATPLAVLCAVNDSIVGPKTFCADDKSRVLFDTILANLDKADLGLGSSHQVAAIDFLPKSGAALTFEAVASDAFSGVQSARKVVIKDAAAWEKLWAEHSGNRTPAPALPKIDFSKQMLAGLFAGVQANGCHSISIARVSVNGGRIQVEYEEGDITTVAVCATLQGTPMQVVALERSDAPVDFVATRGTPVGFKSLELTMRSGIKAPQTVTIRTAATFSALWAVHGNGSVEPAIDFSKSMVLGVFMGTQPNGCYSTAIDSVNRVGNTIRVLHIDAVPGPNVLCTLAITAPAHLIVMDRSELTVEFAAQKKTIQ